MGYAYGSALIAGRQQLVTIWWNSDPPAQHRRTAAHGHPEPLVHRQRAGPGVRPQRQPGAAVGSHRLGRGREQRLRDAATPVVLADGDLLDVPVKRVREFE